MYNVFWEYLFFYRYLLKKKSAGSFAKQIRDLETIYLQKKKSAIRADLLQDAPDLFHSQEIPAEKFTQTIQILCWKTSFVARFRCIEWFQ